MATPATWIAVANEIVRSYKSIEDIEPDEFWKDEQERSDWFEYVADTGHALANLILKADELEARESLGQRLADALNAQPKTPPTEVMRSLNLDPETLFSEGSELSFDDPDNSIIDFGWEGDHCVFVQRIDNRWHLRTLASGSPKR